MATYTPVLKVVAVTAASGVNGITTAAAALSTAVATAVTTAQAVTGIAPSSLTVSPATLAVDTTSAIFEMYASVQYTVIT